MYQDLDDSDGSIIDPQLGFTTTNEEGETVFLSTGDGIVS